MYIGNPPRERRDWKKKEPIPRERERNPYEVATFRESRTARLTKRQASQRTISDESLIKMIWYARWKNKLFIIVPYMKYRYIRTYEFFGTGWCLRIRTIRYNSRFTSTQRHTRTRGSRSLFRGDHGCAAVVSTISTRERERKRERQSLMYPTTGSLHVCDAFSDTGPSTGIVRQNPWQSTGRRRVARKRRSARKRVLN